MEITPQTQAQPPLDLETIAQRVVALAEISVSEHLHAISRSQADGLLKLARDAAGAEAPAPGSRWR